MIRSRLVLVVAVLGASMACSANQADYTSDSDDQADTANGDADADTDVDSDETPPDFWALDADLGVVAGAVDTATSALTLTSWVGGAASCVRVVPVTAAAAGEAQADLGALSWWSLDLGDGETPDPPCDFPRPATIELGFAPPDARLQPAMDERGLGEASAYSVLLGGDRVFVFGIAGTDDNLAGRTEIDPAAVTDGLYHVVGLQLLPVR